jgi:hypothetical protein
MIALGQGWRLVRLGEVAARIFCGGARSLQPPMS